jgi:hypothetical protein
MDNKISTAVIYYSAIIFLALAFCGTLVVTLNWPPLAEIPLAVAIFIQILALSKSFFSFWADHKEQLMNSLVSRIKAALFSLDTQEEEVNV